ncbi:MAG: hypothetical protein ACJATW_001235 [Glaciecola sp.]|jgi:hypothetical protein
MYFTVILDRLSNPKWVILRFIRTVSKKITEPEGALDDLETHYYQQLQ